MDLSKVPRNQRAQVKEEVGLFVVDEILREVSEGKSPVSGEGRFAKLNPEYAEREKGGDRTATLDLEGDMLNALTAKNTRDGVEIGIFKKSEVGKADGHNNHSGESSLPRRRFIPTEQQSFNGFIQRGVERIIRDFESEPPTRDERRTESPRITPITQAETTSISLNDILSDDFLSGFLFDGES